ncbi:DUF177 domain-containing protein [Acidobacteria bacterium AH-259-O06]|nr:DUF177 domain-containing protein [Acidobacteria bacterium AH-259-O06]
MLVDIKELRERNEPLFIETDFGDQELKLRSHIMALQRPVRSELRVSLSGGQVLVVGEVQADLQVVCCRCLKPFPHRIRKGFEVEYWPDPALEAEGEEFGLTYTDLVIGFYRKDRLDVSAVISEQIVLEMPMKPVCQEACKGLCDQCGADLNEGNCNCQRRSVDPRLAVLLDVKKRLSKEK